MRTSRDTRTRLARPVRSDLRSLLPHGGVLRIVDANANRAREGLRVVEDVARFVLREPALTRRIKVLRHAVSTLLAGSLLAPETVLCCRDSRGDLGRATTFDRLRARRRFADTVLANMRRAQESLRVLEELGRLFDPVLADGFKRLRYRAYVAESDVFEVLRRKNA
jgi:thiamine-phosphate pyrophosphorylase